MSGVVVVMGNNNPLDMGRPMGGRSVTTFNPNPDDPLDVWMRDITHEQEGGWVRHSLEAPAWVESNVPELAEALAAHYDCPIGRPDTWEART